MSRGAFPLAWLGQLGPLLWRTSQRSLKRDGPGQPLQFGLVSIAQFRGQNFQAEVPGIRHQTSGTPAWSQGMSCSALMASSRMGRGQVPPAQGEVIALFTCWGAQQRPFTPEVLDKSPWIQRASYLADKIKPWIVSLRNLHFENLAFESLNMFMPRSCPCEIMSNRWRSRSQLHGCLLNTWSQQKV